MIPFSFVTLGAFIGGLGHLMTARDWTGRSKPISGDAAASLLSLLCRAIGLVRYDGDPERRRWRFRFVLSAHIPPFLLLFSLKISCKKREGRTENGTNE